MIPIQNVKSPFKACKPNPCKIYTPAYTNSNAQCSWGISGDSPLQASFDGTVYYHNNNLALISDRQIVTGNGTTSFVAMIIEYSPFAQFGSSTTTIVQGGYFKDQLTGQFSQYNYLSYILLPNKSISTISWGVNGKTGLNGNGGYTDKKEGNLSYNQEASQGRISPRNAIAWEKDDLQTIQPSVSVSGSNLDMNMFSTKLISSSTVGADYNNTSGTGEPNALSETEKCNNELKTRALLMFLDQNSLFDKYRQDW